MSEQIEGLKTRLRVYQEASMWAQYRYADQPGWHDVLVLLEALEHAERALKEIAKDNVAIGERLRVAKDRAETLDYQMLDRFNTQEARLTVAEQGIKEIDTLRTRLAEAEERQRAAIQIIKLFYGCSEHVYPKEICIVCEGRRGTLDQIIAAIERAWAALSAPPPGVDKPAATMLGQPISMDELKRISKDGS